MPTSEEARDWLAHAIANDELAHYGVPGMKWGHRKSKPPASGIKSHDIDKLAKTDAKERAKLYLESYDNPYAKGLVNRRIASRSEKDPEYAKAFAYHKPLAEKSERVKGNIIAGAIVVGSAAYIGSYHKDFLMRLAGSAALKVAARRGAKAAAPVLKAIGNKPITLMAQGLDGVWRLAA